MDNLKILVNEQEIFIKYYQAKFPLFYNSNIFLRDLQYAVQRFLETKKIVVSYTEAEKLAIAFATNMAQNGKLLTLGRNTWKVNFHPESITKTSIQEKSSPVTT